MKVSTYARKLASIAAILVFSGAARASFFATTVVEYIPGIGTTVGFDDPSAALGSPTRFTAPDSGFGGAVTPFNSPFGPGELVTIGEGGSLTLGFDTTIFDDPANPFGIDLLIFGNSFAGINFGTGLATGSVFSEGGNIELSTNGIDWFGVPGVDADGWYPTLGYQDMSDPFPSTRGSVLTNFQIPVDPALDFTGLNTSQIAAAYAGSGGGAGIDIAITGLLSVNFVRITNPVGSGMTPEIDGISIVPAPGTTATLLALLGPNLYLRRRNS